MTKKEKFLKFWNDRIFNTNEPYRYIVINMMCTKGGVDYNERLAIGCDCWKFRRDDIMGMFNDELEASNGWRLESYFACSETDYEDIEFYTLVKPREKGHNLTGNLIIDIDYFKSRNGNMDYVYHNYYADTNTDYYFFKQVWESIDAYKATILKQYDGYKIKRKDVSDEQQDKCNTIKD